jgi:hypothetical protein
MQGTPSICFGLILIRSNFMLTSGRIKMRLGMIIPNLHRYYNNADSENRNISMTRIWF